MVTLGNILTFLGTVAISLLFPLRLSGINLITELENLLHSLGF